MTSPLVLTGARVCTMAAADGFRPLVDHAIALRRGVIAWLGPRADVPAEFAGAETIDVEGRLVTPGLIDCHTHSVYAGSRAHEFEQRLHGATYEDIARAGGGIRATVTATRAASPADLLGASLQRVDRMLACGVTTLEIKSGYGLDHETELKMLRCARAIEAHRSVRVRTSFLGAHTPPRDMAADAYLDEICLPALRAATAEGLVDAVDGYCEAIAFSRPQIARLFEAAHALGLPVRLHAEQLSNQGGAALAASYNALCADHLEYLDDDGVAALAQSKTVAVLLPGAFYALRETQKPPIAKLRAAGVAIAIATDCNPGTSPLTDINLAMNMAATLFGLTPEETLRGVTLHAARALGLSDCGQIAPGLRADLAVWDCADPAELTYLIGRAPLSRRIFAGAPC
jgi:imidazolonepropionase